MAINKFNLRVYGILINEKDEILVSDEWIKGHKITKFPGGGLEFGEGLHDCVKREFMEETNNEVEVVTHFYTTDYFQVSAYNPSHQVISIYYLVKPKGKFVLKTTDKAFDFDTSQAHAQSFRWIPLKTISEADFTLAIDKLVGGLLEKYSK